MSLSITNAAPGVANALALLQTLSQPSGAQQTSATAVPAGDTTAASSRVSASAYAGALSPFAVADGVSQALSTADAADAAGQGVVGLLQQMQAAASQAADPSTPADARASLDSHYQASAALLGPTLSTATVNGANLVDGSLSAGLKVALGDGATASLTPVDLSLGGSTLRLSGAASIATADAAGSALARLGTAIGEASAGLSSLRTQADQIGAHANFIQTLGQVQASSDQGGDSARLMALQVSQQLSAQPASIANQSPQSILSLFRS